MKIQSSRHVDLQWFLQAALVVALLVYAALIVLQQANPALNKLGRDAGAYIYIGSHVLRGDAPYLTAWDSKPPGIFVLDAAGIWLGRGTRWGIWLLEFASLSAASIFGFLAMRKQFGVVAALTASMIWLYGLNGILIGGNLTEEYSLFFGFLSVLLFSFSLDKESTLWTDIGIGLCAGGSFLFRPNNMGVQVSIVLTIMILSILERRYSELIRRLLVIGLAALAPLGLMSLYLISKGALQAFWEATITYNFSYAGGSRFNALGALANGLTHLGFASGGALFGFLAAGSDLASQIKSKAKIHPIVLWILLEGILEIMLSGLSGRNYEHYFINWLPFVAFATAMLIARIAPQLTAWTQKRALIFLAVFALAFGLYFSDVPAQFLGSIRPLLFDRSGKVQYADQVAEYVHANTTPTQTVLVWGGQAGVNFLAQRDAPDPYLFFPLGVPSKITDRLAADYYRSLTTNPPTLIVDGSVYDVNHIVPISASLPVAWLSEHQMYETPYLLEALKFIHENYALVDNVSGADIYRFKK